MIKIIIIILIIIILIFMINYFNIFGIENFVINNNQQIKSNELINSTKTGNNKQINKIQNSAITQGDNKSTEQKKSNTINRVLFNNKDYNENLSVDNKDNKYYYDDMINQSNINETAFNIVYSIDPIDYADVKTGIQKCNEDCEGVCFENGYDGIATCYPKETDSFDWGTLYKNPSFTYGYNAYGPNNLKH